MSGLGVSIRTLRISLTLLGLTAAASSSATAGERLLQPLRDTSGWLLRVEDGQLEATRGERRQTLRLRRGEVLDAVAETATGWVAAGGRESDSAGRQLLLLASDGFASRRLAAPAQPSTSLALRPVLFVERGELVGMAWLEGDDPRRLEVRAATLESDGWSVPETVAGPAPGSQTALSGSVLADGSWLLVWSAYDGSDDEIHWSRRASGLWSAPDRLHAANDVPDVTPTLVADDRGTLVAWSRLEGDEYATVLARFDGARWSRPQAVAGAGSFYPVFHSGPEATHLVMRSARPRGWAVLEIGSGGSVQRQALFATATSERPVVALDSGRDLTLSWPGAAARETALWETVR